MKSYINAIFFFLACLTIGSGNALAENLSIPALVGQTQGSATFGKNETDGYLLAIEEWNSRGGLNGKQISLQVEDTQTSQKQIISGFQRLASMNPPVILGPTWLDGFQGVIPIAQKREILLVTPSAAREAFSSQNADWPVTFYHNSTIEITTLIDALKLRGYTRPALIYEQEPFAEMIRTLVLKNDISLVADYGVQAGQAEFQSLLAKLKSKKPDVLLIFVWDERSLLSLLQQLKIQFAELPLATVHDGAGWIENPAFRAAISRLIFAKFIVADSSFNERFKKRFGYEPILTASNAYDAMSAVLAAKAAGKNTGKEIREYLLSTELNTVTFGKFKFGSDGSVPSKVEIVDFKSN